MFAQRTISWNSALRGLKADREIVPAGLAGARAMAQTYSRTRKLPLVVGGTFDRRAIMVCATLAAKNHQRQYGGTWAQAMAVALKATWQAATMAKRVTKH